MDWITDNADWFAVVGAVTMFINWTSKTFIESKYDRLKQGIEGARRQRRLYESLADIHSDIRPLISLIHSESQALRQEQGKQTRYWGILDQLANKRLNANQVTDGAAFTSRLHEYSSASSTETEISKRIEVISVAYTELVMRLRSSLSELDEVVHVLHPDRDARTDEAVEAFAKQYDQLAETYRSEILVQHGELLKEAVDLSNTREQEIESELQALKKAVATSRRLSYFLYAFGTALILIPKTLLAFPSAS